MKPMYIVLESTKLANAKMFLSHWPSNGAYERARFCTEFPDAVPFTSRARARVAARVILENITEGEVFIAGEYGTEHETWESCGTKSEWTPGSIEWHAERDARNTRRVIDVYSDAMTHLTSAERIAALQTWQALPLRPAYAYPSSETAGKLGYAKQGCWYVEGTPNGTPVNGVGYATKSEAYDAAGVQEHKATKSNAQPTQPMVNQLDAYVGSLRNPEKKDYAARYAIWRVRGGADAESVPAPQPFHMGTMAAQAVRMAIETIVKGALPQHCCSCGSNGKCNLCGKSHEAHTNCATHGGNVAPTHTSDCARAYDLMAQSLSL